jgi:hypothetical protein
MEIIPVLTAKCLAEWIVRSYRNMYGTTKLMLMYENKTCKLRFVSSINFVNKYTFIAELKPERIDFELASLIEAGLMRYKINVVNIDKTYNIQHEPIPEIDVVL